MARNRIIYQSEALFAGQLTGVTDAHNENQIKQLPTTLLTYLELTLTNLVNWQL